LLNFPANIHRREFMQIKPFQSSYPHPERIALPDAFFGAIREDYNEYLHDSYYEQSQGEVVYVYQISGSDYCYTGLLACADVRDYLAGHIRKHEHTLAAKEETQLALLSARRAAVKPVLLAYPAVAGIQEWMQDRVAGRAPDFSLGFQEEGNERHSFWAVQDPSRIRKIRQLFADEVPNAYIADGHHRAAATARLHAQAGGKPGRYDGLLSAFFPSTDIAIHDFNRVVHGLHGHTPAELLAALSRFCAIVPLAEPAKPARKHELTMLLDSQWYRLSWKAEVLARYAAEPVVLDAMLLDDTVFRTLLGIQDVRTAPRVQYVAGPQGVEGIRRLADELGEAVAFCLYPIQLTEMMALADQGQVLPPKSTWFQPRMKNGLVLQRF
jgi:uncharacterized protein (DUF1015 family)